MSKTIVPSIWWLDLAPLNGAGGRIAVDADNLTGEAYNAHGGNGPRCDVLYDEATQTAYTVYGVDADDESPCGVVAETLEQFAEADL